MADEKLNTGPEAQKTEEAPAPAVADPAHEEAAVPEHPPEQAGPAEPGDVVISAEQIDALMAEKRQAARAEVEKAEASREQEAGAPAPERPAAESEKAEKPRRGRPPKSDKTERTGPEAEKEPKNPGPARAAPLRLTRRPRRGPAVQTRQIVPKWRESSRCSCSPDAGKDKPAKEAAPPEQGDGAGCAAPSCGGGKAGLSETFRTPSVPYIPPPSVQGAGRCQNAGNRGIHQAQRRYGARPCPPGKGRKRL